MAAITPGSMLAWFAEVMGSIPCVPNGVASVHRPAGEELPSGTVDDVDRPVDVSSGNVDDVDRPVDVSKARSSVRIGTS